MDVIQLGEDVLKALQDKGWDVQLSDSARTPAASRPAPPLSPPAGGVDGFLGKDRIRRERR